jgi:hypothetical protein
VIPADQGAEMDEHVVSPDPVIRVLDRFLVDLG